MTDKSKKTVAQLEEEAKVIAAALVEAKKVKEADNADEVDVKKDKKDDAEDKDDGKEPDVKDDGEDDKKDVKEAKKKKRLTQSYREEDQPAVETHGDPLTGAKKLVGESIAGMFDGETLSEDFKKKAATVFEAALTARINEEIELIEAAAQAALDEAVSEIEEDLMEKADDYVGYVVSEWLEENKLAVESALKLEIHEGFFEGLKALFLEHNITIPTEKLDILEAKEAEVVALTASTNALTEKLIAADKTILELKKNDIVAELSEGLADTQVEKLKALTKDIEAKDAGIFKEKATIIRENFFKEEKAPAKKEADGAKVTTEVVDKNIQLYLDHAKKHNV